MVYYGRYRQTALFFLVSKCPGRIWFRMKYFVDPEHCRYLLVSRSHCLVINSAMQCVHIDLSHKMAAHLTFSYFLITVLIGKILVKFNAKLVFFNSGGVGGFRTCPDRKQFFWICSPGQGMGRRVENRLCELKLKNKLFQTFCVNVWGGGRGGILRNLCYRKGLGWSDQRWEKCGNI